MRANTDRSVALAVVVVLLLLCSGSAHAQNRLAPWEHFDFAHRPARLQQLDRLSLVELKYLRGIVFGRHGRVFDEVVIQSYLKSRPWYKPNPSFRVSVLNAMERRNMDLIKEAEWREHPRLEPGDLRFYRNRVIARRQLRTYTLAELRIMRAEIEALHGKRFDEEPWLRAFFVQRYWYHPATKYSPSGLSIIERKNIAMLAAVERWQRHLKLAPGMMEAYQRQTIAEDMLHGLGLYELRLLRNEIYARRGQHFHTWWLQRYFVDFDWYRPRRDYREALLSDTESHNVDVIVNYENHLHQALATKPVTPRLLQDLSVEEARKLRNEIYARRGKRFRDPLLHDYFTSFAWYQPAGRFNEHMLSRIEKRNAARILAYERHAREMVRDVAA